MATKNDKSKATNTSNIKTSGNKNAKSGAGLANSMPASNARGKAKDMDSKRRGDTETFNL